MAFTSADSHARRAKHGRLRFVRVVAVLTMYATLGSGMAQLNFYHEFPSGSDAQA